MNIQVAEECAKLSEEEKIAFPEVIARLDKANIESYVANMLVPNIIYHSGNKTHEVKLNIKSETEIALVFNQENVIQAIRSAQSHKIRYQEFVKRIKEAGVILYLVFIKGRRVIYCGRNGEQHIEYFP